MKPFEPFVKPAIAIWRGSLFFLIGLSVWAVSTILPPPFTGLAQKDRAFYHDFIDKTVLNLDGAAKFILIAASIYVIIVALGEYLWSSNLETLITEGFEKMSNAVAIGSAKVSNKLVLRWIENSNELPEVYKAISSSCLTKYYGSHSSDENSYLEYVIENLLDTHAKCESITRYNYNINIVVRKLPEYGDLLQWEERKDYVLKCPAGKASIPIGTYTSFRANFDNVDRLVNGFNLLITIDGKIIFSFQKWKREAGGDVDVTRPFKIEPEEGGILSFDGKWIIFEYYKTVELTKCDTHISVVEESFIAWDERSYSFISREPAYNVSMMMRLEGLPGWQLQKPNIGTRFYHAGASEFAKVDQMKAQWVSAKVPKWVLPGVWATVEWAADLADPLY